MNTLFIAIVVFIVIAWMSQSNKQENLVNVGNRRLQLQESRFFGTINVTYDHDGTFIRTLKTQPTYYMTIYDDPHIHTNETYLKYSTITIINMSNQELKENTHYTLERFTPQLNTLGSNRINIYFNEPTTLNRFIITNISAGPTPFHIACIGEGNVNLGHYAIRGGLGGANIIS
jgi:hypothetical protein